MKIAYYMPFKPLGHKNPSGDLIIGSELYAFLAEQGAEIRLVSRFRCRWLFLKPWLWPLSALEMLRVVFVCAVFRPDVWLTYHSYYKAPDILGPFCCRLLAIPYCLFQGIYSTKRRKRLLTWAGFQLNRRALRRAEAVFVNKRVDAANLARLLPPEKICYLAPGLHPGKFSYDRGERLRLRAELGAEEKVVIMTAAMFRPGVKTKGVHEVIASCLALAAEGLDLLLLIAGDGSGRGELEAAAAGLGERCRFLGRVGRQELPGYYSAADLFAFPGYRESLGMVYLEAQACRLPVVAYGDWGAKEAVVDGETGLLADASRRHDFTEQLRRLAADPARCRTMGLAAERHVRRNHDLAVNYARLQARLEELAGGA